MTAIVPILDAIAERVRVALGLPEGQVFIDRRTGDAPGDAAYIDMDGEGLTLLDGQGTVCADQYTLSLLIGAILSDNGNDSVYAERLGKLGTVRAALTWRSGAGIPIPGVGMAKVVSASVTEPFDSMDRTYGLAMRWRGQVFLNIGEP